MEYAKETPTDILIQISVCNRGPDAAPIHALPTLWFRNVWTWWPKTPKPSLRAVITKNGVQGIAASDAELGDYFLYCEGKPSLLFTENETNNQRIFGTPNAGPYVKDGINDFVVAGKPEAVNPGREGTKAAANYQLKVGQGQSAAIRLRLTKTLPDAIGDPFGDHFSQMLERRHQEADEFYRAVTPESVHEDEARVMRQALAGMLWTKQYYFFDLAKWHQEHGRDPAQARGLATRNREWAHMVNDAVISMPDKWEYPWFAAWDLAFHTIALSTVDVDFAQRQLELMLKSFYLHPTGQMPAYEWNFGDVNPPVHAWAAIFLHRTQQALGRKPDLEFLTSVFTKLSLNFTWWTNRKDRLCVQRRLACSAGERPAGARVRSPVVWIAGWRETKTLKPIDNVSLGKTTSHRAVTTVNAKVASKVRSPEGRVLNRRAKAAWGSRNLTDAAPSLRRGGSDSTVARTCRATGEALLVPARNRRSRVDRITGSTGKSIEGERVTDGFAVAVRRGNARGAKEPCCL